MDLTRRGFLGLAVVAPLGLTCESRSRVGHLDVHGHRRHLARTGETLHVYVDGVDVTHRCAEADDERDYAIVLCTDSVAHSAVDRGHRMHCAYEPTFDRTNWVPMRACQHRLVGCVEIRPGQAFGREVLT